MKNTECVFVSPRDSDTDFIQTHIFVEKIEPYLWSTREIHIIAKMVDCTLSSIIAVEIIINHPDRNYQYGLWQKISLEKVLRVKGSFAFFNPPCSPVTIYCDKLWLVDYGSADYRFTIEECQKPPNTVFSFSKNREPNC